jgi:hypothetical protein
MSAPMPCVLPLTIATLPASREVDEEEGGGPAGERDCDAASEAASEAACEGACEGACEAACEGG